MALSQEQKIFLFLKRINCCAIKLTKSGKAFHLKEPSELHNEYGYWKYRPRNVQNINILALFLEGEKIKEPYGVMQLENKYGIKGCIRPFLYGFMNGKNLWGNHINREYSLSFRLGRALLIKLFKVPKHHYLPQPYKKFIEELPNA